ncbi:MAG: hypothetical protein EZS28_034078 [Streblomastix strix]|uniref:Uncharacterized protein n=1 Tax=Streblomastix strix TaxID=222440 RepID=A0A5J4UJI4_9EUKA|nr:MAG: hypothetical protein EZS28_034078 [Streblomastix strix]
MKNKANWDSFVLTGCNAEPTDRDGVWKVGSTSSQFRIQKQEDEAYDNKGLIIDFDCTTLKFNNQIISPLPAPPIDYAIYQSIGYGKYEQLVWDPMTVTWHNILAVLKRQLGLQTTKNKVFFACLLSLTKWVIVRENSEVFRCISVLEPISSNIINVDNNLALDSTGIRPMGWPI